MLRIANGKPVLAIATFLAALSWDAPAMAATKAATGTVTRISVSAGGVQGNNDSYGAA